MHELESTLKDFVGDSKPLTRDEWQHIVGFFCTGYSTETDLIRYMSLCRVTDRFGDLVRLLLESMQSLRLCRIEQGYYFSISDEEILEIVSDKLFNNLRSLRVAEFDYGLRIMSTFDSKGDKAFKLWVYGDCMPICCSDNLGYVRTKFLSAYRSLHKRANCRIIFNRKVCGLVIRSLIEHSKISGCVSLTQEEYRGLRERTYRR